MTLPENRKKFEELVNRWIRLEENTINEANNLIGNSKNPMVRAVIDLLKIDSEKHRHILQAIQQSLNSTVTFSTDDLKVVDTFVENHMTLEKNAIETAEQALAMSSLPIPRLLLSHLLEDEKSHDAYMSELNDIKVYMAKDTD
jgi:rubrerythrin